MKKFKLLTIALLSFISGNAQNLEFLYQGVTLKDGATVTIAAEENIFGEMSCETNPSTDSQNGLVLKCPAAFGGIVTANLQILSNTLNASTIQWCMGGECTLVRKEQLTKSFSPGPNIQVLFDATNIIGDGSLMAKLSVQFNGNTRNVYIQFVSGEDETSIHKPQFIVQNKDVFDLSGKCVDTRSFMSNLNCKKLYIVNGKKILK